MARGHRSSFLTEVHKRGNFPRLAPLGHAIYIVDLTQVQNSVHNVHNSCGYRIMYVVMMTHVVHESFKDNKITLNNLIVFHDITHTRCNLTALDPLESVCCAC